MPILNTYTTLAQVRQYLNMASANNSDDDLLIRFMRRASNAIDTYTRRKFYPHVETRKYDLGDVQTVKLDKDLLSLTTLSTQNGSCAVGSTVLFLGTGQNWNRPPYDRIVIDSSSGSTLNYSGTPQKANHVLGIWGYHEDWGNAWVDTGTSLANAYTASAAYLSFAGAGSVGTGASDIYGEYPRISIGNLLKVDSEYFYVVGGATSGNGSALVVSYANGTTGASHAAGASVYKFQPEGDIEWSAMRLTAWLYGQKDTPYQTKTANFIVGNLEIPTGVAVDVKDKIDRFVRREFATFP